MPQAELQIIRRIIPGRVDPYIISRVLQRVEQRGDPKAYPLLINPVQREGQRLFKVPVPFLSEHHLVQVQGDPFVGTGRAKHLPDVLLLSQVHDFDPQLFIPVCTAAAHRWCPFRII